MPNRRVHAECDGFEVVRYDRAGKWYVESKDPGRKREHVGIHEAAIRAFCAVTLGGQVHTGIPGGGTFDRWVEVLEAAR